MNFKASFKSPTKALLLQAAFVAPLLAGPLLLGACADQGPWPLPTGYTYYNQKYKAPPAAKPAEKVETPHTAPPASAGPVTTEASSTSTSVTAVDTMPLDGSAPNGGDAATELVTRLFGDFGKPAEAVWIQPATGADPAPAFDGQLRAALQAKNVPVSDTAGGGPFGIRYKVEPADGGQSLITLTLTSGGMKAAEASGTYKLVSGAVVTSSKVSSDTTVTTTGASDKAAAPIAEPTSDKISSPPDESASHDFTPPGDMSPPPGAEAPLPLGPMH